MYPYNTLSLTHGFKILLVHLHPIPHFVLPYRAQPQRRSTQGKDGCQMQLTQRASNTLLSPFISLHREISTRPPHTSCQPHIPFFVLSLGEIWSLLGLVKAGTSPPNSNVQGCTMQPLKNERWCPKSWCMIPNSKVLAASTKGLGTFKIQLVPNNGPFQLWLVLHNLAVSVILPV